MFRDVLDLAELENAALFDMLPELGTLGVWGDFVLAVTSAVTSGGASW